MFPKKRMIKSPPTEGQVSHSVREEWGPLHSAERRRLSSVTCKAITSPGCWFNLLNSNLWTRCFLRLNPMWDRDHKRSYHALWLDCPDVRMHSADLPMIFVFVYFPTKCKWEDIRMYWQGPTHCWGPWGGSRSRGSPWAAPCMASQIFNDCLHT